MAGEHGARLRSLNAREAAELLGLDRDLLPEADLVSSTTEEADTVRVQRLVDRRSARLCTGNGDTASGLLGLLAKARLMTITERLDDGGLHCELDQVHREEPDYVL